MHNLELVLVVATLGTSRPKPDLKTSCGTGSLFECWPALPLQAQICIPSPQTLSQNGRQWGPLPTHRGEVWHQVPNKTTLRESHGLFPKIWVSGRTRLCWLRPVHTFPHSFPGTAQKFRLHSPSMLSTFPVPPSLPTRALRKTSPSWYKCKNLQARGSLDSELERKHFSKGNIICRGMVLLKYPSDLHY